MRSPVVLVRRAAAFDPGLQSLRSAVVTLLVALVSFGIANVLRSAAGLNVDIAVIAVVLAINLSRSFTQATAVERLMEVVEIAAIAIAAGFVGRLMIEHRLIGDTAFVIAISASIYLRKFGSAIATVGSLMSAPFIVILVTPVPVPPGSDFSLWAGLMAAITLSMVIIVNTISTRIGFTKFAPQAPPRLPNNKRIDAHTRMALQMGVSLAVAFVFGRHIFTQHWAWLVLTAFIVSAGNRGRADVIHKGAMRVLGALGGTVLATIVAGVFAAGDKGAIVAIFALLALALWLRSANYAYWAACVTASLAFLYEYFGQNGTDLLFQRVAGVFVGGLIAVVVAWYLLPIRTSDVFRRREADGLAALSDCLGAVCEGSTPEALGEARSQLHTSIAHMRSLVSPLRLILSITRRGGRHDANVQTIEAMYGCLKALDELQGSEPQTVDRQLALAVRQNVIELRMSMRDRREPLLQPVSGSESPMAKSLIRINNNLAHIDVRYHSSRTRS